MAPASVGKLKSGKLNDEEKTSTQIKTLHFHSLFYSYTFQQGKKSLQRFRMNSVSMEDTRGKPQKCSTIQRAKLYVVTRSKCCTCKTKVWGLGKYILENYQCSTAEMWVIADNLPSFHLSLSYEQ